MAGLSAVALAIDLGRLYFAQRDLQRMANMAALDSARVAGGCLGVQDNPGEAAFNAALRSLERNGGEASLLGANGVQLGRKQRGPEGLRYFESNPEAQNRAVEVSLLRPIPLRLFPLAGESGRQLRAVAAAYSSPQATVVVGSKLAELDPDILNNALSAWLGGPVSLDAVTYRHLFGASVPFNTLIPPEIGSPDEPLDAPVPLSNLLQQIADALGEQGNMAGQAAAEQLADAARDDRVVTLRELVGIEEGFEEPAREALVQVGPLITSAAQVANGTNLIEIVFPTPPPTESGTAELRVIEAARQSILAPGEAENAYARNAQGLLEATIPLPISDVGLVQLRLFAQTAQATATVEEILCARRGQEVDVVYVAARSSIQRIGIGEFDDIHAPNPRPRPATIVELTVEGVPVRITGYAITNLGEPGSDVLPPYVGPFGEEGITQSLGTPSSTAIASGMTELARTLQLEVVLPPGLPPATSALVTARLQPIINSRLRPALADALNATGRDALQDLSETLGLTIGGADVTVLTVAAEEPYLFTH